jgi:hypothetical protein
MIDWLSTYVPEVGIIVLIAVLLLISMITSSNDLINKSAKGWNLITKKGYRIILLNLIVIGLTVLQYYINKSTVKSNELVANKKQTDRDSTLKAQYDASLIAMKNRYDSANLNTIGTITDILGKYGFKLDSTNNELLRVVEESSKTKVIIQDQPVLQLNGKDGIHFLKSTKYSEIYELDICSVDAASTNFSIFYYIAIEDTSYEVKFIGYRDIDRTLRLSENQCFQMTFEIPKTLDYKYIYIWIKGNYSNLNGKEFFPVDDLYYYNKADGRVGKRIGKRRDRIIKYMSEKVPNPFNNRGTYLGSSF